MVPTEHSSRDLETRVWSMVANGEPYHQVALKLGITVAMVDRIMQQISRPARESNKETKHSTISNLKFKGLSGMRG